MKRLSYFSSASKPLVAKTVGNLLRDAARLRPHSDACVFVKEGAKWSYKELLERCEDVAQGLLALGLRNTRVGVMTTNCSQFVVSLFAAALSANILVCVNPAYQQEELQHAINSVGCAALVVGTSFKETRLLDVVKAVCPELDHCKKGELAAVKCPSLKCVISTAQGSAPGVLDFQDLYGRSFPGYQEIAQSIDFEAPVNIQFTSGTTGKPKAAVLTHHGLVNNDSLFAKHMKFSHTDRICLPVPLNHSFGFGMGVLAAVSAGSTIVIPDFVFSPRTTLDALQSQHCTTIYGVPTMFQALLNVQATHPRVLDSLKKGVTAGAVASSMLLSRISAELRIKHLVNVLGMTETSSSTTCTLYEENPQNITRSVGYPMPGTEVKIVNDHNETVPIGTPGELCVRGFFVMKEYWNNPQATAAVIDAKGWLRSGDVAVMSADHSLSIIDRKKDIVIRGGENISPSEVEAFYLTHPSIEEIYVVGAPDPHYGEVVSAWVRVRPGHSPPSLADLREFGTGKIADFKLPAKLQVVESFPLSPVGKVLKRAMRDMEMKQVTNYQ